MDEVSQLKAEFEQFLRILLIKHGSENPKGNTIDFEERQMVAKSGKLDAFVKEASQRANELIKKAPKDADIETLRSELNQLFKNAANVLRH